MRLRLTPHPFKSSAIALLSVEDMNAEAAARHELGAALRTEAYMFGNAFRGYDPYDALLSPIFGLPVLRSLKLPRLAIQQALRRVPINVRPLFGIPRGLNPVTLGLAVEAYSYLSSADPENAATYRARVLTCIEGLKRLRSTGYSGDCWGYDFPWESRWGKLPAFTPTIVATGIITNGLFQAYELLGIEEAFSLCSGASQFVLRDLERTVDADGSFCWGYFPGDRQQVINATMKGARLCAQVHSVSPDEELAESSRLTAQFAVSHQREDGAWPYAVTDPRSWVDNFHTGYVLDCLREYELRRRDAQFEVSIRAGWNYYRAHFFEDDRVPRYFDTSTYPIDITACAQSIITLSTFRDVATRDAVASWVISNMQKADGSFIYQIRRTHKNRISYMRWGAAWMFAALGKVAYVKEVQDELERASFPEES
ncbi:MAG: delta-aminolevulinic acid dehydratase [Armatimonadetes bacterium]|nr:delta-aminolevulinic acid dehydratase [Armatimonadota bacterium]